VSRLVKKMSSKDSPNNAQILGSSGIATKAGLSTKPEARRESWWLLREQWLLCRIRCRSGSRFIEQA